MAVDRELYKIGRGPVVADLSVVLDNRVAKVWNVLGLIRGKEEPDRYVILGKSSMYSPPSISNVYYLSS